MQAFKPSRQTLFVIVLGVAVAAILIGITLHLMKLPTPTNLVMTDVRVIETEGGTKVYFQYMGPYGTNSMTHTLVVVRYTDGTSWEALLLGDTAYYLTLLSDKKRVTFTAIALQQKNKTWAIIDPIAQTVSYQDTLPE